MLTVIQLFSLKVEKARPNRENTHRSGCEPRNKQHSEVRPEFTTAEEVYKTAKPGDMLEFDRGAYSHWGIYLGLGRVIHPQIPPQTAGKDCLSTCFSAMSGQTVNKALVQEDDLKTASNGGLVRVNNMYDEEQTTTFKQRRESPTTPGCITHSKTPKHPMQKHRADKHRMRRKRDNERQHTTQKHQTQRTTHKPTRPIGNRCRLKTAICHGNSSRCGHPG
ncbi:hypothetical protein FSP39_008928 [Pinctada imbricata]|uniref:LRAT domain-containing protein n=1 Tax=Pinctada imbricata TaxID=66713 RepID=A0AA89BVM3_PINIB|nr:hypothetical protein FSP39_008928 [Pinctada imbricata]